MSDYLYELKFTEGQRGTQGGGCNSYLLVGTKSALMICKLCKALKGIEWWSQTQNLLIFICQIQKLNEFQSITDIGFLNLKKGDKI
jgi:hypothetical protein